MKSENTPAEVSYNVELLIYFLAKTTSHNK